jgi:hypothetical protein
LCNSVQAVWPQATILTPPEGPVKHLSPGSPRYRRLVGEMAYADTIHVWGKKYFVNNPLHDLPLSDDEKREALHLLREFARAKAEYRRACAWAWPYANLRQVHKQVA